MNYLVTASGDSGIYILDVSDVGNISILGNYGAGLLSGTAESVALSRNDGIVYCAVRDIGILTYDISDFDNI